MSNKLRLIRIGELKKKPHLIEQLFIDLLDGIEEFKDGDYIEYMKYGDVYFDYSLINNNIWTSPHIHYLLEGSYEELCVIIRYLLEKHLKITINKVW